MTIDLRRRALLKAAFGLGAAVCTGAAFEEQPLPQGWIPGHVESQDPTWQSLFEPRVAFDEARGIMTAALTDAVRAMHGRDLRIGGFILPISASPRFTHFVLTRRNASCPFCAPNEPTEAIEVFLSQPVEFRPDEMVVSGRFEVISESSEGLFYRLRGATMRSAQ